MWSRILCISGHPEDVRTLEQMVGSLPLTLDHAATLEQARLRLLKRRYAAVVTETSLPDGNWQDVLELVQQCGAGTRLIVTDPQADARLWCEVLNLGAYDLMPQPFYEPEVKRILTNASTHGERALAAV